MRHGFQLEQTAQCAEMFGLMIDGVGVFLENFVAVGARGELKFVNGFRIKQMVFAILPPLVLATGIQCVTGHRSVRKCVMMLPQNFAGNFLNADAFDARRCPCKIFIHHG